MTFLDSFYDKRAGYLYDLSSATGLRHESRQTVFYALGLLARNEGTDVDEAGVILNNIVAGQITDPESGACVSSSTSPSIYKTNIKCILRYGDYQIYPEQPQFGAGYPAIAFDTYYGISHAIMGNALVVALEEFPDLLSDDLTNTLRSSLELNLKSNFTPTQSPSGTAYSLSTSFLALWGGENLNQSNIGLNVTAQGETLAQAVIDNFDTYGSIPEFNAAPYLTFTFWPLAMATKYLSNETVLAQRAPDLIASTWTSLGQWYHADLKNLAAPISRGFGYDLTKYMHSFGIYLWSFGGHENSPFYLLEPVNAIPRITDFANSLMTAIYADTLTQYIPAAVLAELKAFSGERLVNATAFAMGKDLATQNLTAWLAENITIGGVSFSSAVLGPYTESIYIPGAIQWHTGGRDDTEVGYINVYPNEATMHIVASPNVLNVSLPNATATSSIQFQVVAFADGHLFSSWNDTTGLSVTVSGTADLNFTVGFAGSLGGTGGSAIQEFEFWNVTYSMPSDFETGDVPWIALEVSTI